jgi:hypothetical protein
MKERLNRDLIIVKRLESLMNIVPFENFIKKFEPLDRLYYDELLKEVKATFPDAPIFDYEF